MRGNRRRQLACQLAAQVMQGAGVTDRPLAPMLWSLAVFFEEYIETGSVGTQKDFGYKKPPKLKVVKKP